MTFTVRLLKRDQYEEYIRWAITVYGQFYGETEVSDRAIQILKWKRDRRPEKRKPTNWILCEDDSPRGFVSFVPYRLSFAGKSIPAAEVTMGGIFPDYRNQGYFQVLMEEVHERIEDRFSVLTGLANEAATGALGKIGYHHVDCFQYMYYPLRGADMLRNRGVPNFLSSVGGPVLDLFLYGYQSETSDCNIREVGSPGAEEEQMLNRISEKSLFITDPDEEEWEWRYAENSLMPGQWYRVRVENQVIGSFVLAEYPGYLSEQPSVYLAENLWAEDEKFRKVMACAFQTARRNWTEQYQIVSGTNRNSPFASGFSEMGYKSGGEMNFLVRIPPSTSLSQDIQNEILKPDRWFLFGGDRLL